MLDPQRTTGPRKVSKEPAASALTATPRVTGPGAERFGIQEQPKTLSPAASPPTEPDDWGDGLIDLIAKPGWELERAKALLRTGATISQIVEHLVAKGLTRDAATIAAENAIEVQVHDQFEELRLADRSLRVDFFLFELAACVTVGVGACFFYASFVWSLAGAMVIILAVIWLMHWMVQRSHVGTPRTRALTARLFGWTIFVSFVARAFILELSTRGHR
jgi:hypothetical protein